MFGASVKLGVSGATPDLRASPRGAHLATATPAATGLAAVHALESRRRLTRPKRKPTAERLGGGRRVGRLMAPSIAIDIHPEGTAARVDVVNTFRCIRKSFHVVSRRFALSNSVFPQVTGPLRRVRFPAAPPAFTQVAVEFRNCRREGGMARSAALGSSARVTA